MQFTHACARGLHAAHLDTVIRWWLKQGPHAMGTQHSTELCSLMIRSALLCQVLSHDAGCDLPVHCSPPPSTAPYPSPSLAALCRGLSTALPALPPNRQETIVVSVGR
eukprot:103042-Chlamydomonas_euryale.AAC.5